MNKEKKTLEHDACTVPIIFPTKLILFYSLSDLSKSMLN